MGASLAMIDRHYAHFVGDGRQHAIRLLEDAARGNGHGGRWWTLRGRRRRRRSQPDNGNIV
jgi:hypothetical protein